MDNLAACSCFPPMKGRTLRILSAASLLLLGVQFAAAQIGFSTSSSTASDYDNFPEYNTDGLTTCSGQLYGLILPIAVLPYTPVSTGTYQIDVSLQTSDVTNVYIYSANPIGAGGTAMNCVNEYGSPSGTSISFDEDLTLGTTYYIVILTPSTQQPGTLTVGLAASSTTPAPTTEAPSTTPAATTESPSSTPAPTTPAPTTQPATTPPDTTPPDTTPPDTTPPDTTPPDTTPPDTTAPATTPPDTTAPATTPPDTTAPATTAPDTTAPATTVPDTTAPVTTPPATTAPDTTAPATTPPVTTAPATTPPDTTPPDTTAPATTPPGTTPPDTTAPATTPPDTTPPDTTPPDTTAPATTAPDTTPPDTTPPDTTPPDTTPPDTTAPDTTAPDTTAPDTTPPDTTVPDTTQPPPTASPGASTPAPQTTALATSQPLGSTQAPATTAVVPSTPVVPVTTPAPATTRPLASTTPPPATGNVTVDLNVKFTPNPPLAGQPLTVFGDAVASSGPAPTGNLTVFVDGVPVATTPVEPVGSGGRRRLLQSPKSVFSVTIIAPSTPGVHTIIAVFFPDSGSAGGGVTPVAAPVTVDVNIPLAVATVSLALSSSSLLFPFCTKPLKAVAAVTGTNGMPQPNGTVTLTLSGDNFAALGAQPINAVIGTAPVVATVATFDLQAVGPIESIAGALHGQDESAGTKLLPGSYQLTAAYSGNTLYGPATGSARLTVGPKCSLSSLEMSKPKA